MELMGQEQRVGKLEGQADIPDSVDSQGTLGIAA